MSTAAVSPRWRHVARLEPRAMLVGTAAIGAALTLWTRADALEERALLAVLFTCALSTVTAEMAAELTLSTPDPRSRRRMRATFLATGGLGAAWFASLTVAAVAWPTAPAVGRDDWVVVAVIGLTQIAVGSVAARDRTDVGLGPGLVVAIGWAAMLLLPRLREWILPVDERHGWWSAIALGAVAVTAWSWKDPVAPPLHARILRERSEAR